MYFIFYIHKIIPVFDFKKQKKKKTKNLRLYILTKNLRIYVMR